MVGEPLVHSHLTDVLPDDHPLANEQVHCVCCNDLVHAFNNECMQTWIEFANHVAVCAQCVGTLPEVLYANEWSGQRQGGEST